MASDAVHIQSTGLKLRCAALRVALQAIVLLAAMETTTNTTRGCFGSGQMSKEVGYSRLMDKFIILS